MSEKHKGRRKPPNTDVRFGRELVSAAVQAIIRAALDATLWWIDQGRRP